MFNFICTGEEEAEVQVIAKVGVTEKRAALVAGSVQEAHPGTDTARDLDVHRVQINAKRMKGLTKVQTRKIVASLARKTKKKTWFHKLRRRVKTRKTKL